MHILWCDTWLFQGHLQKSSIITRLSYLASLWWAATWIFSRVICNSLCGIQLTTLSLLFKFGEKNISLIFTILQSNTRSNSGFGEGTLVSLKRRICEEIIYSSSPWHTHLSELWDCCVWGVLVILPQDCGVRARGCDGDGDSWQPSLQRTGPQN